MPFKFNSKFKSKKRCVNDSFCVEKRSFHILPGNKSFSFYKNIIIKHALLHGRLISLLPDCSLNVL